MYKLQFIRIVNKSFKKIILTMHGEFNLLGDGLGSEPVVRAADVVASVVAGHLGPAQAARLALVSSVRQGAVPSTQSVK